MFNWLFGRKEEEKISNSNSKENNPFNIQLLILMISDGELMAKCLGSFISICSNHNNSKRTTEDFEQMFVYGPDRKHGNGPYCIEFNDDKIIQRITKEEFNDLLLVANGSETKTIKNVKIIEKYFSDKYLNNSTEKL